MENIKIFKDGSRLIIAIENCSDSAEQILTKMFSALVDNKPISLENVKVSEKPPVVNDNIDFGNEFVFMGGTYKGKTVSVIMRESGIDGIADAYKRFVSKFSHKENIEQFKADIVNYFKLCPKAFEDMKVYTCSLDDFYELFSEVYPEEYVNEQIVNLCDSNNLEEMKVMETESVQTKCMKAIVANK